MRPARSARKTRRASVVAPEKIPATSPASACTRCRIIATSGFAPS
jgi:hypothetical protein